MNHLKKRFKITKIPISPIQTFAITFRMKSKKLTVNAYFKLYRNTVHQDFTKKSIRYIKWDKHQFEQVLNERLDDICEFVYPIYTYRHPSCLASEILTTAHAWLSAMAKYPCFLLWRSSHLQERLSWKIMVHACFGVHRGRSVKIDTARKRFCNFAKADEMSWQSVTITTTEKGPQKSCTPSMLLRAIDCLIVHNLVHNLDVIPLKRQRRHAQVQYCYASRAARRSGLGENNRNYTAPVVKGALFTSPVRE